MNSFGINNLEGKGLSLINCKLAHKSCDYKCIHTHRCLEISLLKSGNGVYTVDNKNYNMQAGDIFIFNNIENHGIVQIDPPDPMINMVIHFDPSFIYSSTSDYFDYRFLKVFFDRTETFKNRLDRSNPYTYEVGKLLLEIEKEFEQQQTGYDLAVKVKLLNILVILTRYFGYAKTSESSYTSQKPLIDTVQTLVKHIDEHYDKDLTLESMAKIVNMNASYLSSIFTKLNGINLWTYICKTRVTRAKEYLVATDKNILEIASLCGFNSVSNFNRIFKKVAGITPKEYRKSGEIY